MASLAPESKITWKKSLIMVRCSLIYISMTPTNESFYEAAVVQLYSEG